MSSPITPVQGPLGLSNPMSIPEDLLLDMAAFASELMEGDYALDCELALGGPPPEVLDQMAEAGRISRQLRECGHELRFSTEQGEPVTVELQDREGKTVRRMLVAEALEIAAGKPLG